MTSAMALHRYHSDLISGPPFFGFPAVAFKAIYFYYSGARPASNELIGLQVERAYSLPQLSD